MENELMNTMELEEMDVVETEDYVEDEGNSAKIIGLVVAGVAGAAAIGTVAYKKLKAKKAGKPKRKLKLFQWVEVENDKIEEYVDENVNSEEE